MLENLKMRGHDFQYTLSLYLDNLQIYLFRMNDFLPSRSLLPALL